MGKEVKQTSNATAKVDNPMNIFQEYIKQGLSVIPCSDKIPLFSWKEYQTRIPREEETKTWSGDVAIICGAVSGGIVCIDFDVKNGDHFKEWAKYLQSEDAELCKKLVVEKTPSGGFHVIYRTKEHIGNVKLSKNKDGLETIETRGEGGYFVCAPSKGYRLVKNDFSHIKELTKEEHNFIIQVARSQNLYEKNQFEPKEQVEGITPFDDFNSKVDIVQYLQSHGWSVARSSGSSVSLKRPNKTTKGISATWNHVPNRLYVFTSGTVLDNDRTYKPSSVYAYLEHGGDFSAAAKQLYAEGYGKNNGKKEEKAEVLDVTGLGASLLKLHKDGFSKGKSTGWFNFDKYYSVIKGQFTVVTGYPSHGKSEFMDSLALNLAKNEGWKFAVFSPENYPLEIHYRKFIEKLTRKPFFGEGRITQPELIEAKKFIDKHFFFIDALERELSLELVLKVTKEIHEKHGIDGLIIDPWNEIELSERGNISETEYIGNSLRKARKFARVLGIHLWIVAHPAKPTRDKTGKYPVPDLYSIHGSAHWRNKCDNGITVFRDWESDSTSIITTKIKYRYAGEMGECYFTFDVRTGTYSPKLGKDAEPW